MPERDLHRIEVVFRYPDNGDAEEVMAVMTADVANPAVTRAALARILSEGLRDLATELLEADLRLPL